MIPGFQEDAQNYVALRASFEPEPRKMLLENVLRFSQPVARRTWLVIYPLFWHGPDVAFRCMDYMRLIESPGRNIKFPVRNDFILESPKSEDELVPGLTDEHRIYGSAA